MAAFDIPAGGRAHAGPRCIEEFRDAGMTGKRTCHASATLSLRPTGLRPASGAPIRSDKMLAGRAGAVAEFLPRGLADRVTDQLGWIIAGLDDPGGLPARRCLDVLAGDDAHDERARALVILPEREGIAPAGIQRQCR